MGSCERRVVAVVKRMEVVAPLLPSTEHRLAMTNLDRLLPTVDVGIFFCYDNGGKNKNNDMMISMLRKGLSNALVSFYSLAGEAFADIELQHVDLYKLDVSAYANFVPVKKHGVLSMQVTEMKCGRLVIGCSFDHRVADLHSMSKFLVAWADMTRSNRCRGNKIASVSSPDYRRSLLHPRQPSHSDPAMGNSYYISKAASSDIPQAQQLLHFQSRIYKINARQVQHLQSLAGPSRTKLQSFSALLWKLLAKSTKEDNKSVRELKSMHISEIADKVHACVETAANEEHFRGLVDWVESHRPRRAMCKIYSTLPSDTEEVAVVISSIRHFPVSEMDFGWGHPSFMSVFFPWGGSTGMVMPMPSPSNNGDWIVYMHLPGKHLDFVEKEAPHIFKPFAFSPSKEFRGRAKL
ncbi:hypothetical protein POM88_011321 [Heracleum sosnowskyi]|uniref:Uncharacterized protein n=1 Tax=Heracleum sosnowskyi TaxID=360622 RepID=A0AAD8MWE5_9APIA|nr:hypothetical protein POM88_011321 [Heracleum sosnowskyi]